MQHKKSKNDILELETDKLMQGQSQSQESSQDVKKKPQKKK